MKKTFKIEPMDVKVLYSTEVEGELGKASVKCDKLGQVAEVYPIAEWTRPVLNEFRGVPLVLCLKDIESVLKYLLTPKKDDEKTA